MILIIENSNSTNKKEEVNAFSPIIWESEDVCKFKASLVYIAHFRLAKITS